jgi:hypothetical protein
MRRELIVAAAEELNEFLDPTPLIDVKAPAGQIKASIIELAGQLREGEAEQLSENTRAVVNALTNSGESPAPAEATEEALSEEQGEEEGEEEASTESRKSQVRKPALPRHKEGSFRQYVDKLLMEGTTWQDLLAKAEPEAKARGRRNLDTMPKLKAHVRNHERAGKYIVTRDGDYVKMSPAPLPEA